MIGSDQRDTAETPQAAELYDAYYYAHGCGLPYRREKHWLDNFGAIADRIISDINPQTVLDAGCAMGFLVEKLRDQGLAAFGIDISEYAIQQVRSDIQPYCRVGSITEPFPQRYDLIVCIEVLEHLPRSESEQALQNLCRYTDDILFSSTPFDYKEATHFNVQPPEYWGEKFAQQGFFRDVDFDASFVVPWAVRFRRRTEPPHRLIRDYERKFWLLSKENQDQRSLILEMRQDITQTADKESFIDMQADLEWMQTQIRQQRRQGWLTGLQRFWSRLNTVGIVGRRPARRLPPLIQPLQQTFTAEYGNLNSIVVLVETMLQPFTQPLDITLVDMGLPDLPVIQQTVSPRLLPLVGPLTLRFPPIPSSQGQTYQLTLHTSDAQPDETAMIWGYLRPGRPNGHLRWGQQPIPGELVMSAAYGPPEASFPDLWNTNCWLPRSFFALDALLDLTSAALNRPQK